MTNSILESEKQIKLMNKATDKQIKYIQGMIGWIYQAGDDEPKIDYDNLTKLKASQWIEKLQPEYEDARWAEACDEMMLYGLPNQD